MTLWVKRGGEGLENTPFIIERISVEGGEKKEARTEGGNIKEDLNNFKRREGNTIGGWCSLRFWPV